MSGDLSRRLRIYIIYIIYIQEARNFSEWQVHSELSGSGLNPRKAILTGKNYYIVSSIIYVLQAIWSSKHIVNWARVAGIHTRKCHSKEWKAIKADHRWYSWHSVKSWVLSFPNWKVYLWPSRQTCRKGCEYNVVAYPSHIQNNGMI